MEDNAIRISGTMEDNAIPSPPRGQAQLMCMDAQMPREHMDVRSGQGMTELGVFVTSRTPHRHPRGGGEPVVLGGFR